MNRKKVNERENYKLTLDLIINHIFFFLSDKQGKRRNNFVTYDTHEEDK